MMNCNTESKVEKNFLILYNDEKNKKVGKNMYKLVVVDLDGTMLNSYGIVTENTKTVIKETIDKGTDVIIASGRPIDSIKTIANEIGSKKYFIAGNGAIIYDIKEDKIIYEKYLKKETILKIIKICEENSIHCNIYTEKAIIAKKLEYNVLYYHKENLKKEENKKTNINIVENIYEYVKSMQEDKFTKVTICEENKNMLNGIVKKLRQISEIQVTNVSHMSRKVFKQGTEEFEIKYYYSEVALKNVNKWTAIEQLMKLLDVQRNEIIAIGDNVNDKEMIENAVLGIVMNGSTPEIIKLANYVTDGNNEEGVAKAIKKFI